MYTESPIRIQMGNIYTTEEFREKSDDILSRPMPVEEKEQSFVKMKKRLMGIIGR